MAKVKQGDLLDTPTEPKKSDKEKLIDQNRDAIAIPDKDKAVEKAIEKTDLSLYTNFPGINAQKMNVLRNTICKGLDFLETCFFLNHCASINLNPFNKEIWAWKDKHGKIQSTAAEAGYRVNAERHPQYKGIRWGVVFKDDIFEFDFVNPDNVVHQRKGIATGKPIAAWCIAYREGMPSGGVVSGFDEYYQPNSSAWNKNPSDMIAKVARAKALSVQFPISGVIPEFETTVKDGQTDYVDHMKGEETQEQLMQEELNNKIAEALEVCEGYEGEDKEEIVAEIREAIKDKTITVSMLENYIDAMTAEK